MGAPAGTQLKAWEDWDEEIPTTVGNPPDTDREPVGGPIVVGEGEPKEARVAAPRKKGKARRE